MRELIRPFATVLTIACCAASFAAFSTDSALAQAKEQAPAAQAGHDELAPAADNLVTVIAQVIGHAPAGSANVHEHAPMH